MEYEAFISYSHADASAARWIQRTLERFRPPQSLIRELDLSGGRLRPVFRDEDELASSADLGDTLRTALKASRCLIVVCSPASATSRWVNEEVATFQALGRADRIICVVAGGDPLKPSTCFPERLRSSEPLAIDMREGGESRRVVRVRLLASVLDVGFDRLRQRDAQYRRHRLIKQIGVSAVAAIVVAGLSYQIAVAPPCQNASVRLAEVWNSPLQERIRQAFVATGLPYAEDTWERVVWRLDLYGGKWSAMHEETCAATLVRGEQSPELMDLRMACLDERRTEFSELARVFESADAALVEQAVDATGALRSLARCEDRMQLLSAYPLPDDPAQRKALMLLRNQLAQARALLAAGNLAGVAALTDGFLASAEGFDYAPAEAEALLLKAGVEASAGRRAEAKDLLYAAAAKAVLAREDELVARAWITLSGLLIDGEGDAEEALDVLGLAQSHITQLSAGHVLEARFHDARANALTVLGRYGQVVKDRRAAVEISRAGNDPAFPVYLERLAYTLSYVYEFDEAQAYSDEAIAISEATFGRSHPNYAETLIGAAEIATVHEKSEEALEFFRRALVILEAAYPPKHPRLAEVYNGLAWSLQESGQYELAIATAQDVLDLAMSFPSPRWRVVSRAYNAIGNTYISMGDYPRAVQSLEAGLDAARRSGEIPAIGTAFTNLGNTANRAGDYEAAERYCRDALEVDKGHLPADSPDLAFALSCIGEALLRSGNPQQALDVLERAHSLRDRIDFPAFSLAWTRWLYGRALFESDSDHALGVTYIGFARRTFREMGASRRSELADVERWLAEQGLLDTVGM